MKIPKTVKIGGLVCDVSYADRLILGVSKNPNPKQAESFKAKEQYIVYGGARGGGTSCALYQLIVDNPKIFKDEL